LAKITTLQEIEEHWSLSDLLDAHEALDIQEDIAAIIDEETRKGMTPP
jgi:hypothetical protein